MTEHTISASVEGEFRPIFSADAIAALRRLALRWVEAGKPNYIPAESAEAKEAV